MGEVIHGLTLASIALTWPSMLAYGLSYWIAGYTWPFFQVYFAGIAALTLVMTTREQTELLRRARDAETMANTLLEGIDDVLLKSDP